MPRGVYPNGNKGLFKKGQASWNKGTKGLSKANKTSFKKGNVTWNTGLTGVQEGYWTGKKRGPMSDEWKAKIAESNRGKSMPKLSEERKEYLRQLWKGKKVTGQQLDNLRKNHPRGEANGAWRGGVTPEHRMIRKSLEYRIWREAVFARDNWCCVLCGDRSRSDHAVRLEADHIKPFAFYPELRFAINNGRTLCRPCHLKQDTHGKRAYKYQSRGRV